MSGIEIWAENGAVEWKKTTAMEKRNGMRYLDEVSWAFTIEGAEQIGQQLLDAAAEARRQQSSAEVKS